MFFTIVILLLWKLQGVLDDLCIGGVINLIGTRGVCNCHIQLQAHTPLCFLSFAWMYVWFACGHSQVPLMCYGSFPVCVTTFVHP